MPDPTRALSAVLGETGNPSHCQAQGSTQQLVHTTLTMVLRGRATEGVKKFRVQRALLKPGPTDVKCWMGAQFSERSALGSREQIQERGLTVGQAWDLGKHPMGALSLP